MSEALLDVRDLRARYGEIEALRGLDLAVANGGIVALLGANGAGKTTTLRAITGAISRGGTVRLNGKPLAGRGPQEAARAGVAHVPEGRGTLGALTVRENLALGAYLQRDRRRVARRYATVAGYFPILGERSAQIAATLSGGEQQMLAIARALMMEPRLLLLDEPSLGLAPGVVRAIFDLLRVINREESVGILLAEQNATLALAMADRAYVLEAGRIALSGSGSDLSRDERVRAAYLGY